MSREVELPFEPHSKRAYLRAMLPKEYSETNITQLFRISGVEFQDDTGFNEEALIDAVGTFGKQALEWEDGVLQPQETCPVSTPGALAVVATYAIIRTKHYNDDQFQHKLKYKNGIGIRPLEDIRAYYAKCLLEMLAEQPANKIDSILTEIGDSLYSKDSRKSNEVEGLVVSSFTRFPDDDRVHVEVPMPHASKNILNYTSDYIENAEADVRFENNCLFLPLESLYEDWETELRNQFIRLVEIQEDTLSEQNIQTLIAEEKTIPGKLDDYRNSVGRERLYRSFTKPSEKVKVIRNALQEQGHTLNEGEWFIVGEIADALDQYEPDEDSWEHDYLEELGSWQAISHFLSEHIDHYMIDARKNAAGKTEYSILPYGKDYKDLDINHPREVLGELPCFRNMDKQLQKEPSRKELFSFVRLTFWLEPFYEESENEDEWGEPKLEKAREALHETFQRWDWYDEEITDNEIDKEYQTGEGYFPMGCNNPTMKPYCIGQDNCPYSIYSSLPFSEELDDRFKERDQDDIDAGF